MISAAEIHWIAGLMEGEGCFGTRRGGKDIAVYLTMVDGDVVRRLHKIVGLGRVTERTIPSGKTATRWVVAGQADAAAFMMTILPLMGERRRAKIIEVLDVWKSKPLPRGDWTHCKHGHPFSGHNLVVLKEGKYTKRRCRKCAVIRQKKLYERRNALRPNRSTP